MDLKTAILTRRSIRKFSDYKVSDKEINTILEAARWAPSWANTQTWDFIVVRDKGLIEKITELYSPNNPARKCSLSASVLIVACSKLGISGCKEGIERTKFQEWFMFDMGMAVQNISLMAHGLGLGSVVVGSMGHGKCGELLKLPEGYDVICAIPVGKPAVEKKKGPPRKEPEEFIHLNYFGN